MLQSIAQDPALTSEGRAWLAKAIHPSDATWKVNGVPTSESVATAAVEFTSSATIASPDPAQSWSMDFSLAPTPLAFGHVHATANDSTATFSDLTLLNHRFRNPNDLYDEFGATARANHSSMMTNFIASCKRYRLMYASVTATMTASNVSNEGTVTCAQMPIIPTRMNFTEFNLTTSPATMMASRPLLIYQQTPVSTAAMMEQRGSVQMEARKGCYSILKLEADSLKWSDASETYLCLPYLGTISPTAATLRFTGPTVDGNLQNYATEAAASAFGPQFGQPGWWFYPGSTGTGAASNATPYGDAQLIPTQANMSLIRFEGLNPACKIVLNVRCGYEMIVPINSPYTGIVSDPILHDPRAMELYYRMAREMLSGYPAEYNILGAIWSGIKTIGAKVLPTLGQAALSALAPTTGTSVVNPMQAPRLPEPPSQRVIYIDRDRSAVNQRKKEKAKSLRKKTRRQLSRLAAL
jgi:hypothetical protein